MSGIKFLLDTNFILAILNEQDFVVQLMSDRSIDDLDCAYSSITRIELLSFPKITPQDIDIIEAFLSRLHYIPFSIEIENEVILIRRQHKLKLPDAVIAATAKYLNLELLTLDQQLANRMQEIKRTQSNR
jgi:predicted nucleic acid-binding protein